MEPIRDSNNNPIILDKNGNPVQDPNLTLLLDKSGFPVLNTLGSPIILDKNQEPLDNKYKIKARLSSAKGKKQKQKKIKKEIQQKKLKLQQVNLIILLQNIQNLTLAFKEK